MKQFNHVDVNNALYVYKTEVMHNLAEWLSISSTDRSFGKIHHLKLDKIVLLYEGLLKHKSWFLKIDDIIYAKIERKIGIVSDNDRDLCKKFFIDLYNKKITNNTKSKIIENLFITTCPYCNMEDIYNYGEVTFRSDIDHFYLKSKFYLFSIFFYNMIPACSTCNSKAKRNNKSKHVNPYLEDMDSLSGFEIKDDYKMNFITNIDAQYDDKKIEEQANSFDINLKCNDLTAQNTDDVFQLTARYNALPPKMELLRNFQMYWSNCPKNVASILDESIDHVYDIFYRNMGITQDENKINRRKFSKLNRDILKNYIQALCLKIGGIQ